MKIYISVFIFNVYFRTGSLLATTCKDKKLRIIDPRSGEVLRKGDSHQGNKASKVSIYYYMNYHSLKFVHSSEIRGLCLMKCSSKMLFCDTFGKWKSTHTIYIFDLFCFVWLVFIKHWLLFSEEWFIVALKIIFWSKKKNDL